VTAYIILGFLALFIISGLLVNRRFKRVQENVRSRAERDGWLAEYEQARSTVATNLSQAQSGLPEDDDWREWGTYPEGMDGRPDREY